MRAENKSLSVSIKDALMILIKSDMGHKAKVKWLLKLIVSE
jgi:hypothetical protein